MLSRSEAEATARELLEIHAAEQPHLTMLHDYWRGEQTLPVVPTGVPTEVRQMARMSRVNLCKLVVDVPAQSLFVDGFRDGDGAENHPTWQTWQSNKLDAHQAAIYRSTFAYGVAYAKVLPGDGGPIVRGVSPRSMTTVFDDDPDWPVFALEMVSRYQAVEFRVYDDEAVYYLDNDSEKATAENKRYWPVFRSAMAHGAGVCPIVAFRNVVDLDGEVLSEIKPIIPLQDQMDAATFDLLVAQHFGAFKQRYVMGWLADSESDKIKASASRLLTFDDPDTRVGEFSQTDLSGYLDSRTATMEQFGVVSQVPPHNLVGQMVNLSAEALVAAEQGHTRKMNERETGFGESWEQVHGLIGGFIGVEVSDSAQVRWRETEARSFAAVVDGLAKLADSLEIPKEALWERIPDVTDQDIERWRELRREGDALASLFEDIDRQLATPQPAVTDAADR